MGLWIVKKRKKILSRRHECANGVRIYGDCGFTARDCCVLWDRPISPNGGMNGDFYADWNEMKGQFSFGYLEGGIIFGKFNLFDVRTIKGTILTFYLFIFHFNEIR